MLSLLAIWEVLRSLSLTFSGVNLHWRECVLPLVELNICTPLFKKLEQYLQQASTLPSNPSPTDGVTIKHEYRRLSFGFFAFGLAWTRESRALPEDLFSGGVTMMALEGASTPMTLPVDAALAVVAAVKALTITAMVEMLVVDTSVAGVEALALEGWQGRQYHPASSNLLLTAPLESCGGHVSEGWAAFQRFILCSFWHT